MSDSDAGMFDFDWNFNNAATFGTFTAPNQADDFARPFDLYAGMSILFITGNEAIWALGDYAQLRQLVDARQGTFSPNYTWTATSRSATGNPGNVLSRSGPPEDPWISLTGDHITASQVGDILWGEADWAVGFSNHETLKNSNGGVNVFVSLDVPQVPVPAAGLLLVGALGALGAARCRKRGG